MSRWAWVRRELPWLWRLLAFLAVLVGTTVALNLLRSAPAFWAVLSPRFDLAYQYQLQQVFLPDRAQDIAVLIVGDPLFQASVPDTVAIGALRRVVISDMDAADASNLFSGLDAAHQATRTRVCNVIVQTSPNFLVMESGEGPLQEIGLIPSAEPGALLAPRRAARVFAILKAWAGVSTNVDFRAKPHARVPLHVGKTRFADPALENWNKIVRLAVRADTDVLFLVDARQTDWGAGSNLLTVLPEALGKAEAISGRLRSANVVDAALLPARSCDSAVPAAGREIATGARQG